MTVTVERAAAAADVHARLARHLLVDGFELVADELALFERISEADLVITGEGFLD